MSIMLCIMLWRSSGNVGTMTCLNFSTNSWTHWLSILARLTIANVFGNTLSMTTTRWKGKPGRKVSPKCSRPVAQHLWNIDGTTGMRFWFGSHAGPNSWCGWTHPLWVVGGPMMGLGTQIIPFQTLKWGVFSYYSMTRLFLHASGHFLMPCGCCVNGAIGSVGGCMGAIVILQKKILSCLRLKTCNIFEFP